MSSDDETGEVGSSLEHLQSLCSGAGQVAALPICGALLAEVMPSSSAVSTRPTK